MNGKLAIPDPALIRLRWRWIGLALISCLAGWAGYSLLASAWNPGYALRWLAMAASVQAYLLWRLWHDLAHNHRAGEVELLPALGPGNSLTLARGLLIAGLAGFLLLPHPQGALPGGSVMAWIPAALYTLASLADFLDGYLARRANYATRLGELLDMNVDSIGVLTATMLVVRYGQAPAWFLLVGLARYIFLGGTWLRRRLGKPVYELPPSASRRFFAGLQMCLTFFLLWPVFTPPGTAFAAALFSLPFLAGFARDWLVVSGALRPRQVVSDGLHRFITRWLPVGLRALAVGLWLSPWMPDFSSHLNSDNAATLSGWIVPERWVAVLALAEFGVILLLALGLLGRGAAAAGLLLLGLEQAFASLTPAQYLLAAIYVALLYLGTGAYSLWKPEDRLVYYRAGERIPIAGAPVEARPRVGISVGR